MIKFRQKNFAKFKLEISRIKRIIRTKAGKFRKKVIQETEKAALNPGKTTSDTIGFVVENPIASTGIATGYSVAPIPGTTAGSLALEGIAKKKAPIYKRVTGWVGNKYKSSELPKIIESTVNTGIDIAKSTPGVGY